VARSIQAALAEHRKATAQPLTVRIGLHAAEATQRGADYSGIGVHVAARIAALGAGGEIVASADTLEAAGRPALDGDVRLTTIRGVSAPVRVATVAWT
jgi:class 3 adenylate cyclase